MLEREPGRSTHLAVRPPARGELVDAADERHGGLIDGDRPAVPHRAQRRPVAARHAESPALRRIALPDPLGEPAAVRLGLDRLPGPALPLVLVGREDPLVGEQDDRAPGVEVVAGVDRGPQVPGEAGHVADDEDLPVLAGAGEHLGPLAGGGDRPPGVGDLPGAARVDEAPALDRSRLLLELGVGPEVVRLARRGLADPARRTAAAEVLERAGQGADGHATSASRLRLHGDHIRSVWRHSQGHRDQSSAGRRRRHPGGLRVVVVNPRRKGLPLPAVGAAAGSEGAGPPAARRSSPTVPGSAEAPLVARPGMVQSHAPACDTSPRCLWCCGSHRRHRGC